MSRSYPMAVVKTPGKIEFEDRTPPEPAGGQVLIKVRAVSICGSDIHTFKGKHPFAPLPAALGHELAGEIVDMGDGVEQVQVGDRVVLEPVITCNQCEFCGRGAYNLCTNISFHHRQGQGAFTEYFVAGQERVFKIPDTLSFEQGALMEPLAVAVHAVNKAGITLGDRVAVFGAGAIGLMILVLSRLQGAAATYAVDIDPSRLKKALAFGAAEAFDNRDNSAVQDIIQGAGGLGVDVAFEAVGFQTTFVQALQVLKKGGTAIIAGLNSQPEVTIPSNIFVQKEITLKGTQGYCHDFQTALELVKNRGVDLSSFITHTLPFDSLQEGFDLLIQPESGAIKVVITFDA